MRRAILAVALAVTAAGCGSSSRSTHLTLHVDGPVARTATERCTFFLRAAVREGGSQRTCLTSVDGFPAPDATMHSTGVMTFALPRGRIVVRVRVTQRFAADGAHARQTARGTIVGGTHDFAGARGSLAGGGDVVDGRAGIRVRTLTYALTLAR